jgi:hypothetical protein
LREAARTERLSKLDPYLNIIQATPTPYPTLSAARLFDMVTPAVAVARRLRIRIARAFEA